MTTRDLRLLALVGLAYGMRWAWRYLLRWLLTIQLDSMVAGSLVVFAAVCAVVLVLALRPQFRWLPHRGGR